MKFSFNFLKTLVDIDFSAQELARGLTLAGLEIEEVEKAGSDWVFSAEVTTNRYDWLSMVGIAQEVKAVFGKKMKVKYPKIKHLPDLEAKIIVEDKSSCSCYLAKQIQGVRVKPSLPGMKEILFNSQISAINNIVDITNYCMLKWGNPLHAFDRDKIEGDVRVRKAVSGEEFVGIDQKKRLLSKENLVIADAKKIIALAGVMGAANTQVTQGTKNILLEAAIFSPVSVRRSRRQAGLDTESSYRFERRVPEFFLEYASQEAADLIVKVSGGKLTGRRRLSGPVKEKVKKIIISFSQMQDYLGTALPRGKVKKILNGLNFKVESFLNDKITIKPAPTRFDVEKPVDIYEEFARIYGYAQIKPKLPFLLQNQNKAPLLNQKEGLWQFKEKVRDFAALLGFSEIITYSLENKEEISEICGQESIQLENPLRNQNALRPALYPGMLKAISYNLNRGQDQLAFFEIADIYQKKPEGLIEKPRLSLGVSGQESDFFVLKGKIIELLDYFNLKPVEFKVDKRKNFTNSLSIVFQGCCLGFAAKLDRQSQEKFGISQAVFFAALELPLLHKYQKGKTFELFSRFPAVWRDISLAIKKPLQFQDIEKIIKENARYLAQLKLIDTYQGKDLSQGYRAFTLRLGYQSAKKTLSSQEVDNCQEKIRQELAKNPAVILR